MSEVTDFTHRIEPGVGPAAATTLLLLHGTGGDENDLIPLGRLLAPHATLLSVRGKVREHGMPRFFRRLAEGVFDLDDLRRRTHELADWLDVACDEHLLTRDRVVAVGFSNGANIAASMLLLRPGALAGAMLLSPMVPFEPEPPGTLVKTPVWIGAGRADAIAPFAQAERLAAILAATGAAVSLYATAGGHGITADEVEAGRAWLSPHLAG